MSASLQRRVTALERKGTLSAVLIVIADPGETIQEAVDRACAALGRQEESFRLKLAFNFHGRDDEGSPQLQAGEHP